MPTKDQVIPNKPLSGSDVAALVLHEVNDITSRVLLDLQIALNERMSLDPVFGHTYSHPRLRVEVDVKFHFGSIHMPVRELHVAVGHAGDPIKVVNSDDVEHFVEGVHREFTVDNPNAARQRAEVPVVLTEVQKPRPTEMFGQVVEHHIPVTGGTNPMQVSDTDTTEQIVKDKKVPQDRRLNRKGR